MQQMKRTDRITNPEVLRKMERQELRLLRIIKESKQGYIEEKLRNDGLFALASTGKIIGKGRQKTEINF